MQRDENSNGSIRKLMNEEVEYKNNSNIFFQRFPHGLQMKIFSKLQLKDLFMLKCTCKNFSSSIQRFLIHSKTVATFIKTAPSLTDLNNFLCAYAHSVLNPKFVILFLESQPPAIGIYLALAYETRNRNKAITQESTHAEIICHALTTKNILTINTALLDTAIRDFKGMTGKLRNKLLFIKSVIANPDLNCHIATLKRYTQRFLNLGGTTFYLTDNIKNLASINLMSAAITTKEMPIDYVDFTNANLINTNLSKINFAFSHFDNALLTLAKLEQIVFCRCWLMKTIMVDSFLDNVTIQISNMNIDLSKAIINSISFSNTTVNANLHNAIIKFIRFIFIDKPLPVFDRVIFFNTSSFQTELIFSKIFKQILAPTQHMINDDFKHLNIAIIKDLTKNLEKIAKADLQYAQHLLSIAYKVIEEKMSIAGTQTRLNLTHLKTELEKKIESLPIFSTINLQKFSL